MYFSDIDMGGSGERGTAEPGSRSTPFVFAYINTALLPHTEFNSGNPRDGIPKSFVLHYNRLGLRFHSSGLRFTTHCALGFTVQRLQTAFKQISGQ